MVDAIPPALRQRFVARCREDLAWLRAQAAGADRDEAEARSRIHRLSGTAGSFGHAGLSRLAADIDAALAEGLAPIPADLDALIAELARVVADGG